MMSSRNIIGNRLKRAREAKGFTQVQVKHHTNINNKTLSGYEKGVSEPDIETLKTLAKLYETSVNYLSGFTDDPTPPAAPKTQTRDEYVLSAPNLPDALIRVAELSSKIDDDEFTRLSRLVIAKFGAPKAAKSSDPAAHTTHNIPGTGVFDDDFDDDDTGGRNGRSNR